MQIKEDILGTLTKKPFIQVPFPLTAAELDAAAKSFLKFLELPDAVKFHIDTRISEIHRRGDVGLKRRDPQDDPYNDLKDFFHFHPFIFKEYGDFLKENPIVEDFLLKAKMVWEAAYKTVHGILSDIEKTFPGTVSKVFETEQVHLILRFLKYEWASSGKYLAKPHFDAGSFTLAIAESCPGLRIGRGPEDLSLVHHKVNHALFMFASNFKKLIETDRVTPGWHDVIQVDESQIGKPFARWAIVAFIDGAGVEALPKSETHKWPARGI